MVTYNIMHFQHNPTCSNTVGEANNITVTLITPSFMVRNVFCCTHNQHPTVMSQGPEIHLYITAAREAVTPLEMEKKQDFQGLSEGEGPN